jgi:hypothetical protein
MMIEDFPSGRFRHHDVCRTRPGEARSADRERRPSRSAAGRTFGHRWIKHEHGLPLGISASRFSEVEVTLGEHSRIAFYSDGITEADVDSGEEYGANRFSPRCNHQTFRRTVCSRMSGNSRMERDCATMPR